LAGIDSRSCVPPKPSKHHALLFVLPLFRHDEKRNTGGHVPTNIFDGHCDR
jgi:hypothetical protein